MDRYRQDVRGPGGTLRLLVPPEPRYASYVRERVISFTRHYAIPDLDADDFVTAVCEALANAVEHSRTTDEIEVACWMVGTNELVASVIDRGVGFDSGSRLIDDALPDPFSERGRGLPLMQRCTDRLEVDSAPGAGTAITLARRLRGHPEDEQPTTFAR